MSLAPTHRFELPLKNVILVGVTSALWRRQACWSLTFNQKYPGGGPEEEPLREPSNSTMLQQVPKQLIRKDPWILPATWLSRILIGTGLAHSSPTKVPLHSPLRSRGAGGGVGGGGGGGGVGVGVGSTLCGLGRVGPSPQPKAKARISASARSISSLAPRCFDLH